MRATTVLPAGYQLWRTVDLRSRRLHRWLNGVAAGLLLPWVVFALWRPRGWLTLAIAMPVPVLVVVLHEWVHGLVLWLLTRTRPVLEFVVSRKELRFSTASPAWYLPRDWFAIVALAPLGLITLLGCLVAPIVPAEAAFALVAIVSTNAAGAVADLYSVARLHGAPGDALVRNYGHRFEIYRRAAEARC